MQFLAVMIAIFVALGAGVAFILTVALTFTPIVYGIFLGMSDSIKKYANNPIYTWWQRYRMKQGNAEEIRGSTGSFTKLNLSDSNLHNSELPLANFEGSILRDVNFSNTNLWSANLKNCDLSSADFTEANLENADLRDANLENAYLQSTQLEGALFNQNTKLPFSKERATREGMISVA